MNESLPTLEEYASTRRQILAAALAALTAAAGGGTSLLAAERVKDVFRQRWVEGDIVAPIVRSGGS